MWPCPPWPPAWTTAEIRSARPAGARSCRKGTQLSFDRARGGAEQEYRGRDRQTSSRHGGSDYMTATLHLVTRMLGPGLLGGRYPLPGPDRSEERRVGKERRARGAPWP